MAAASEHPILRYTKQLRKTDAGIWVHFYFYSCKLNVSGLIPAESCTEDIQLLSLEKVFFVSTRVTAFWSKVGRLWTMTSPFTLICMWKMVWLSKFPPKISLSIMCVRVPYIVPRLFTFEWNSCKCFLFFQNPTPWKQWDGCLWFIPWLGWWKSRQLITSSVETEQWFAYFFVLLQHLVRFRAHGGCLINIHWLLAPLLYLLRGSSLGR